MQAPTVLHLHGTYGFLGLSVLLLQPEIWSLIYLVFTLTFWNYVHDPGQPVRKKRRRICPIFLGLHFFWLDRKVLLFLSFKRLWVLAATTLMPGDPFPSPWAWTRGLLLVLFLAMLISTSGLQVAMRLGQEIPEGKKLGNKILNKSRDTWHLCVKHDFSKNVWKLSPLSMMFAVAFKANIFN